MPKPGPNLTTPDVRQLRRNHPCATAFLDETGAINRDQIFGVGLLRVEEPSRLLRAIQKERDRAHWYKEIKFSDLTLSSLSFFKRITDVCFRLDSVSFYCFIADRAQDDPVERFGSAWAAYGKLAEQLVVGAMHQGELMNVLADNYSTPDSVLFEEDLRRSVNQRLNRLAVTSVCRLDSRSADGLQVADVMTSAVALEFRHQLGKASATSPKGQLSLHVRQHLGTNSCLGGFRNDRHSVAIYEHGAWTPPEKQRRITRAGAAKTL